MQTGISSAFCNASGSTKAKTSSWINTQFGQEHARFWRRSATLMARGFGGRGVLAGRPDRGAGARGTRTGCRLHYPCESGATGTECRYSILCPSKHLASGFLPAAAAPVGVAALSGLRGRRNTSTVPHGGRRAVRYIDRSAAASCSHLGPNPSQGAKRLRQKCGPKRPLSAKHLNGVGRR